MNRKIILQALCCLLVLASIGFIIYLNSLGDIRQGVVLMGRKLPLKAVEVGFVVYYLVILSLFVKSFFTK